MYDAVVASANEMSRHAKQQKQVLLIITDGGDNASRLTLDQAIRRVQALDCQLSTVARLGRTGGSGSSR